MAAVEPCAVHVYKDACTEPGELTVTVGGQAFNVCPHHRKMIESEIPPTPQPWDDPAVIVRGELERWKAARRKHEANGDLDAARLCGEQQQVWYKVLAQLEGV